MTEKLQSSLVPIPDPTILTTAALKLSIDSLKEFLLSRIEADREFLNERINNNGCLDEKRHRETREWIEKGREHRLEVKADAEKALDRAFSAAKELNDQQRRCNEEAQQKFEQSFGKQIDALGKEARLSRDALSDRISVLERANDRGSGKEQQEDKSQGINQWSIGLIVLIFLSVATDLIIIFRPH